MHNARARAPAPANDKWEAHRISTFPLESRRATPRDYLATRRNGKPPLQVNPTASAIRVNQSTAWSNGTQTPFAVESTPGITNDTSARRRTGALDRLTSQKQTDLFISWGETHDRDRVIVLSNEMLYRDERMKVFDTESNQIHFFIQFYFFINLNRIKLNRIIET